MPREEREPVRENVVLREHRQNLALVGDLAEIEIPNGNVKFEILEISR